MQNRKILALAAVAALAGVPVASHAAPVITFTWEVSTDGGITYAPVSGPVTLAKGSEDFVGLLVNLNGTSPNAAASAGYSVAPHVQPAFLGLTSYGFGFSDSNSAASAMDPSNVVQDSSGNTDLAGTSPGGPYSGVGTTGTSDGAGGVTTSTLSGSFLAATASVTTTAKAAGNVGYGGNANAEIFRDLGVTGTAAGTSIYTPLTLATSFNYTINTTPGSTGVAPTYGQSGTGYTTVLPTLTINVTGGVGPHSIISLLPGTTPASGYGSADGSIAMTGAGHGSYNVTTATGFTTATTGSVLVSGFNPATDQEIYALKLSQNGTAISPTNTTLLSAIASDINGGNGNTASAGVSASLIGGVFASLFPGYDLLITSTGAQPADAGGNAVLGFDFSSGGGEANSADAGITVTGVAAVPEPATAAGVVLGAAGLLLGRRKNRLAAA